MISAQDLTRTRICAGANCPEDAEHGSELCWRCTKGAQVRLHQAPEVYTGPTLPCCSHARYFPDQSSFLPDEAFSASNKQERRGRHQECRDCRKVRLALDRALWTPDEIAADRAKQAARRRRLRAKWTPEQHEERRRQGREYDRARRATLRAQLEQPA
jgi:hypothetical protein